MWCLPLLTCLFSCGFLTCHGAIACACTLLVSECTVPRASLAARIERAPTARRFCESTAASNLPGRARAPGLLTASSARWTLWSGPSRGQFCSAPGLRRAGHEVRHQGLCREGRSGPWLCCWIRETLIPRHGVTQCTTLTRVRACHERSIS